MIKTEMMEQNMERLLKWQREVEINRRSLEEKRKEREKEVLRQLRALQTVAQQCKEIKLNEDLQQAKNDYDGLRAELDNAIAVKHHLENNSNELAQKLSRTEEALLASRSKENELRRNFEEMKKEKDLLCCQSDEKSEKIHQLEEALKIAQHLLKETQKTAEEMKNKSLSQKIELEAQEAELQHLKSNNKLLQDSIQELQLENGTLKNLNKALEEEKLDNLKSTIQLKKQNGFACSEKKTWMKSWVADIPIVKTDPYILCRTTLNLRTSPRLAAQSQKLSPCSQLLRKGRSDNLGEICKPTAGGSKSQKVDDAQQCQAETAIEPMESSSRSLCINEQPTKPVAQTSRENLNTHKRRCSLSTQTSPEQNEEGKICIIL
ncbi:centromere protein F-like isoform X2 [Malaclemys terrapin pileata]|uniref:centromere protein F-like isoform X2 n=1 Tax=Malaclemys terrapin pileata TaxID=2991368 RepID=UPI0023A823BE|nr:centromere protein F-like isoform X2 [Malaclemys terrapin pileata]